MARSPRRGERRAFIGIECGSVDRALNIDRSAHDGIAGTVLDIDRNADVAPP
jgi:hypothetical protein